MEHGLDLVCGSLRCLSGLIGEAQTLPFQPNDLCSLVWLIEEKAHGVRKAVLAQMYPGAAG